MSPLALAQRGKAYREQVKIGCKHDDHLLVRSDTRSNRLRDTSWGVSEVPQVLPLLAMHTCTPLRSCRRRHHFLSLSRSRRAFSTTHLPRRRRHAARARALVVVVGGQRTSGSRHTPGNPAVEVHTNAKSNTPFNTSLVTVASRLQHIRRSTCQQTRDWSNTTAKLSSGSSGR